MEWMCSCVRFDMADMVQGAVKPGEYEVLGRGVCVGVGVWVGVWVDGWVECGM